MQLAVFQAADYISQPMPTLLTQDGFDVMIYTRDHPPAHVHVWKAGGEAVIDLGGDAAAPSVRDFKKMRKESVRKAVRMVEENQAFLLIQWREIHG